MKKVTVLIPVFNEEKTVFQLLKRVAHTDFLGCAKEIVIVNDGSSDRSLAKIEKFRYLYPKIPSIIISHKTNLGKGTALQSGFKKAKGHFLIIQDADLEYHPKYYPRLLKPLLEKKRMLSMDPDF